LTPVNYAAQAWSIGVEEQFYAVWPWFLKGGEAVLPSLFMGIVAVKFAVDNLCVRPLLHVWGAASPRAHALAVLLNFLNYFRVECLAIGGLAAFLVLRHPDRVRPWIKPTIQWLAIPLFFLLISTGECVPWATSLWSAGYALLLINIGASRLPLFNLETKWLDWLGRISYGIYMYHLIVLAPILKGMEHLWNGRLLAHFAAAPVQVNAALYLMVLAGTIVLAGLSYQFFELQFLSLKRRLGSFSQTGRQPASTHV